MADELNNSIRKITSAGIVTAYVSSDAVSYYEGVVITVPFRSPKGIAVDDKGNVYVSNPQNNVLRKITPDGTMVFLALSFSSNTLDGNPTYAGFSRPGGLALDATGNLYVADSLIRRITPKYTISGTLPAGLRFDPTKGTISGTPLSPVSATTCVINAYNSSGYSQTTVTLNVVGQTAPVITYPGALQNYIAGTSIAPLAPGNSGGGVVGWQSYFGKP